VTRSDLVFFDAAYDLTVGKAASLIGLENQADGAVSLSCLCSLNAPRKRGLAFLESVQADTDTMAVFGAVICRNDDLSDLPAGPVALVHPQPQIAFATIAASYLPGSVLPAPITVGVSCDPRFPHASVSKEAVIEDGVIVGPGAVIGAGVEIGARTVIGAHAVLCDKVRIGRDCAIGSGTVLQFTLCGDRVVFHSGVKSGQDGFGYLPGPSGMMKMPQTGRVIVQDDVEVGANTTIDRGAIDDTVIGEGSKIDNLVQIGHNVHIGRHVVLCGQVGLSGSCRIGDGAMLGGGAGVANGVVVGAGAQLAAHSGAMYDIPGGERWAGTPAQPIRHFFREQAALRQLVKNNKKN